MNLKPNLLKSSTPVLTILYVITLLTSALESAVTTSTLVPRITPLPRPAPGTCPLINWRNYESQFNDRRLALYLSRLHPVIQSVRSTLATKYVPTFSLDWPSSPLSKCKVKVVVADMLLGDIGLWRAEIKPVSVLPSWMESVGSSRGHKVPESRLFTTGNYFLLDIFLAIHI